MSERSQLRFSLRKLLFLVGCVAILCALWTRWPRLHHNGSYRCFDDNTGTESISFFCFLYFREDGEVFFKSSVNSDPNRAFYWMTASPVAMSNCLGRYTVEGDSIHFEIAGRTCHAKMRSSSILWIDPQGDEGPQEFNMDFLPAENTDSAYTFAWPPW